MAKIKFVIGIILLSLLFVFQITSAVEPAELVDMREEMAKFYPAHDNLMRGDFYTGPVHYQDTKGKWQDIDLYFTELNQVAKSDDNIKRFSISTEQPVELRDQEFGVFENKSGDEVSIYRDQFTFGVLKNKFGFLTSRYANESFVMMLSDKERIVFKMKDINPTRGLKDKNSISYEKISGDVSLRYTVTAEKVKEEIIIPSSESPMSYSYSYKGYGLKPEFDENQLLQFVDAKGSTKVTMSTPFVEDSNGEISYDIKTDYKIAGNHVNVTVSLNPAWMKDPKRAYPVVLDPTLWTPARVGDAYVDEYGANNTYGTGANAKKIRVGVYRGIFVKESRSWGLLKFNLKSLPTNSYIESANLSLYCYDVEGDKPSTGIKAHAVVFSATDWNEGTVTWNNSGVSRSQPSDPLAQNLPNSVQTWNKAISPSVITNLVNNPSRSILLWTYHSSYGYIRNFASKEYSDSTKYPKLQVYYSHVPLIENAYGVHNTPSNEDLAVLGFKDKLSYRIGWSTTFPYNPGISGTNYSTNGRVTINVGANTISIPESSLATSHSVDFGDTAETRLIPNTEYGVLIETWCAAHSNCYSSTNSSTWTKKTLPSFNTNLSFSGFDWEGNPGVNVSLWPWTSVAATSISPEPAFLDKNAMAICYSTDTNTAPELYYREIGETEFRAAVYPSFSDGYRHKFEITGLQASATYEYFVRNQYSWDTSGLYTIDLGEIQVTTPDISYSGYNATTANRSDGLINATVTWNTDFATDGILYFGTTDTCSNYSQTDPSIDANHTVTIAGIAPGLTYYYQVGSKDSQAKSRVFSFTVPLAIVTGMESYYNIVPWNLGTAGSMGINTANGNLIASKTHLALAGRGPVLAIAQYYNMNSSENSALGPGWRMSYDSSIVFDNVGSAIQTHEDGSCHVYAQKAEGGWISPKGEFTDLQAVSGGYKVRYKDGTELIHTLFGDKYWLTEVRDRFGHALYINRDPVTAKIQSLRRAASTENEVFYYYTQEGYLDYILTKTDPATGKAFKIDFSVNVVNQNGLPSWSELHFTLPYELTAETGSEPHFVYHMDPLNTYVQDGLGHQTMVGYYSGQVNNISSNVTSYDTSGNAYTPNVKFLTFTYSGNSTSVTDGRNSTITYLHNPDSTLSELISPALAGGQPRQAFQYNNQYQIIEETHSKTQGYNISTKFEYDTNGKLIKSIEDCYGNDPKTVNNTTVYTYEPLYHQVKTVTDPRQYAHAPDTVSFEYIYNETNGVLQSVEPRGSFTSANYRISYTYTANFDIKTKTVYNTNTQYPSAVPTIIYEYGYDSFGQLESVFYTENGQRKLIGFYKRDMFGRPMYSVDANGTIFKNQYNKFGLLTAQERPKAIDASTLSYVNTRLSNFETVLTVLSMPEPNPTYNFEKVMEYNANTLLTRETDQRGKSTSYEYDELGRMIKVTAPLNLISYYNYDANGNLQWKRYKVQGAFAIARHEYDALNREIKATSVNSGSDFEYEKEYDLAGNLALLKQGVLTSDSAMPQIGKSVMTYDNLGRQTSITLYKYERNADGAVTSTSKTSTNEYDRNGNLIKTSAPVLAQDGIGQGTFERSMTYDAASRLIRENATNLTSTYAGYNYTSNYYYGGGRTVAETHTTRGTSETTTYAYDAGARMKTINGGGQTFTFQYDPNGSRKKVIYGNSFMTADYQYDRSYRLVSLNYNWGSANLGFTYAYREDGKIVSATESGSGGNVPVDWLVFVGADDESTQLPGNYPRIESNILYGGTRTTSYTYNDLGQLINAAAPRYCNAVPEKSFTWGYDTMGNKVSESWQEGSYQYRYTDPEDGSRRVITVDYTNKSMTHTYQNDGRNQIQSSSGMQTKRDEGFDYRTTYSEQYTYDRMGNLVKHVTRASDQQDFSQSTTTTVTTEFNEIWKVAQQTTEIGYTRDSVVNYFYDLSGNMLRESDDAHQDQYYYYGSNGLTCIYDSKLGVKHSYIRAGLQLLSSSDGFYYIVNGRGDVVALVSNRAATYYNSGDIIGYYVYEPFGGLRAAQKQRTVFNKFKFAGGLQSNTGNYAFGSRIYAPGQGRWISMDAYQGNVSDPLSLNRYAYCSNDPVNFVDPSGYFPINTYIFVCYTSGPLKPNQGMMNNIQSIDKCKAWSLSVGIGATSGPFSAGVSYTFKKWIPDIEGVQTHVRSSNRYILKATYVYLENGAFVGAEYIAVFYNEEGLYEEFKLSEDVYNYLMEGSRAGEGTNDPYPNTRNTPSTNQEYTAM
jgi:RHS repeat-associated protein